jgi:hypothetical protein
MARWKRAAALAIVAGVAAISAGAASGWTASAEGASRQAVQAHLAAQGIDPATVVWQDGPLNYAGPNCPGPQWNCTTSRRVVQFAAVQNVAECGPGGVVSSTPSSETCVIMQPNPGATNHARCTISSSTEPLAEQTCDIMQTGERNTAHIDMNITQSTGPEQEARQRAFVEQTATERNDVHVTQRVSQRTSLGPAQTQDAYQLADILQTATGSDNFSHVHQSQDQSGTGNAEEQAQNTNLDYPAEFDCGEGRPEQPNQCARVDQNITSEDGGKNESHLHQAIGERQSTSFGTALNPASQQQGSFDGGQEGDIDQTNPFGAGSNHDVAHEDQRQRQSAPRGGADQTQLTDPNCCGFSQEGGIGNREYINQSVTQSATEDDAFQFSELKGQAVQESGPSLLSTLQASGTPHQDRCRIMHHGRNNSGAHHFQEEASPCPFLRVETICTSGGEVSTFGEGGGDEPCESTTFTEPPGDVVVEGVTVPTRITFPTTPTFGLPIEMPSFGEPPDFPTVPFGP